MKRTATRFRGISHPVRARGFSIISAIFLLVVLGLLGMAMVTFSTNQQQSAALDVMGARAYHAARAGIEWGAYQVLRNGGACAPATTLAAGTLGGTLSGFELNISCSVSAHSEVSAASGSVSIYALTAVAKQGVAGQTGYVERQMQVSIAK